MSNKAEYTEVLATLRTLLREALQWLALKTELYGRTLVVIILLLKLVFIGLVSLWIVLMAELGIGLEKIGLSLAASLGFIGLFNLILLCGAVFIIFKLIKDETDE